MARSTELEAVLRRILGAFEARDAATVRALMSRSDDLMVIGSDPREWLHGVEAIEVSAAQVAEMPQFTETIGRIEAHQHGDFGWAAAEFTVDWVGEAPADFRVSAVFRLEEGVWRVVHWHASRPQSNTIGGVELTTSLSQLIDSLGDDVEGALRSRFETSTVTLLFSDIEDSTRRGIELGDGVWADVVRRHFGDVHRIAEDHGGIVVKTMGDGAMLAYDSARAAARSAVAIQHSVARGQESEPFRVRVGVHTGDAMRAGGDYLGQTVNKTARLAAAALGGQVLVSDVVRGLVGATPGLTFGDPITLELKGMPGHHVAYSLVGG